jgi:2'-5' RNA ligase
MIRTFIAIDLPLAARSGLERVGKELQKTNAPVAWVKPERIHLTLKFLGDVSSEQIEDIRAALQTVAAGASTFRLQPKGCGAFPTIKQMRVVWVGLCGDDEPLGKLQKEVDAAMASLGFKPEDRPFRAHLTLGRVKGRQNLRALQEALTALQTFEAEAFDVTELVLYKSELRREGALYTPLFRAAFAGVQ